jgi:acyl-CoA-binding protein
MSGDLQAQFLQAKDDVVNLSKAPDNEVKLQLYALFKQATEGDYTNGKKPGMMDFVGKVKYEAWKKHEGMSKEAATQKYIGLVAGLKAADA